MSSTTVSRTDPPPTIPRSPEASRRSPVPALFMAMFAAQASLVVITPALPTMSADLGVSTATGGLLRSVSGVAAGVTALAMGHLARRFGLRDLLAVGLAGLGSGSVAGSAAPTFPVLLVAQILVGVSLAVVLAAGIAAAAEWATEDRTRSTVLSWTLAGQPAAWVAGLPVAGLLAGLSWRWSLLVVPVASVAGALLALRGRPADPPHTARHALLDLRHEPGVAGWAVGELLAYSAWTGTLVFAGALFVESYGASSGTTGLLLAAGAAAYVPGSILARRWVGVGARKALVALALVAAAGVAAFGAVRPGIAPSAVAFAGLAFLGGARTMVGSSFGLDLAPGSRVAVTRVRAAALQFGYLVGTSVGGAALAAAGYEGMGIAMAAMFVAATVPHLAAAHRRHSGTRDRAWKADLTEAPGRAG